MKSVVIYAEGEVRVEEGPVPHLKAADDVLVRVHYSGLCGSDIPRIFNNGAHFYPVTLGHEFSGVVEQCGSEINDLKPGDAVACVPLHPCFNCVECQHGYYSLCKNYTFIGSRTDGGNAEFIVLKRPNIFKLPKGMSVEDGAFLEPITVGLHALHLAGGCTGKNVVITGAGTIGLLAIQCAVALGAATVSAIDINPEKLVLAKQLGATHIFNSHDLNAEQINEAMQSFHLNQLIMETAGVPQTIQLAIAIAGPRAQISLVGTLHQDVNLPFALFGQILRKELSVSGSWMNYSSPWPGEEWQTAANLLRDGKIQLTPLIAHTGEPESYVNEIKALNGNPMNGKIILKLL